VIANAGDCFAPEGRPPRVQSEISDLASLGFDAKELDLRDWFGRQEDMRAEIERFDVIWVKGGNTFVLRRAFRLSGLDDALRDALHRDALVYAGYSAGACVATPSLRGIEAMDEPDAHADGYSGPVLWDGLGLVPFQIVPHFRSDHPESDMADTCIDQLIAAHEPFIALRDGETVIVDGDQRYVTSID
jgi:dipeptidase E